MRFSLKWLLAGMVYAAIAAAAFAQAHWSYAELLWAAAFFAVVYALALALFARGRRQAAAGGFAIASMLLAICLHFAPGSLPTARLVAAAFPPQVAPPTQLLQLGLPSAATRSASGSAYRSVTATDPRLQSSSGTLTNGLIGTSGGRGWVAFPSTTVAPTPVGPNPVVEQEKFAVRYRAANAVCTMGAGLLGCALGVLASRRRPTPPATR